MKLLNLAEFAEVLNLNPTAKLAFVLPEGQRIPPHFHVTEVGCIEKRFIDCGGTQRQSKSCQLQLWSSVDLDHRLQAAKLAKILDLAQPILGSLDLPVDVEYGESVAASYSVSHFAVVFGTIEFHLVGRQTDCLAKDKCGIDMSGCC